MKTQFRYLEDFQVGQKGVTLTRTVTEADIVNFACLTADYSKVHVDRHFTANNIYGGRVAHGILGSSLVTGMLSLTAPQTVGRGVAGGYLWSFEVNYRDAIKLSDTIKIQWSIAEKSDAPEHNGFGLVTTAFKVVNQDEASVYDGTMAILAQKSSARDAKLQLKPGVPWEYTEFIIEPGRAYYVEDVPLGAGGESEARTVTEADIVAFAGLTGDYNPQYVDAEFAKKSQFGERIAHGMLIFGITNGFRNVASGIYQAPDSKIAGHPGDSITFPAPVRIGDTLHYRYKILASRVSKSKPELGIITYGVQTINQRNEVIMEGSMLNMRPTRAGAGK